MSVRFQQIPCAVLLLVFTVSGASAFTLSQVQQLLSELDAATQQKDTLRISHLLSKHFRLKVEVPTPSGNLHIELTKERYLDMLANGWDVFGPDYSFSRRFVDIAHDGTKAQVASVVTENGYRGGQQIRSETVEIMNLAVEDGQLTVVDGSGYQYREGEPLPEADL